MKFFLVVLIVTFLLIIPVYSADDVTQMWANVGVPAPAVKVVPPDPVSTFTAPIPTYSAAGGQGSIQDFMTQIADTCPGVGSSRVVVDDSHIGVAISPGPYATGLDMQNAVSSLSKAYAAVLVSQPTYGGYLRIGLAEKCPTGQYLVTCVWEATAEFARSQTTPDGTKVDLLLPLEIVSSVKTQSYTYLDQGYSRTWP